MKRPKTGRVLTIRLTPENVDRLIKRAAQRVHRESHDEFICQWQDFIPDCRRALAAAGIETRTTRPASARRLKQNARGDT